MGRLFLETLEGRAYVCKFCRCKLAKTAEVLSKQFHSKNGKAYLFGQVVNVVSGPREERVMTTGIHVVTDIYCSGCLTSVGWKYEEAYEMSQKYKENKFILERIKIRDAQEVQHRHTLRAPRYDDSDSD